MSETPATYDCGVTCTCDAVTDLASERTELMEEMAAALVEAEWALHSTERYMGGKPTATTRKALAKIDVVLEKFRGRREGRG